MFFKDLKVERVTGETNTRLLKLFPTHKRGFVKIGEKKWFMPYKYAEKGEKVYNFETRPDDTWIVTYPRSGTTLTQELIWLVANDMNFEEAHRNNLLSRFPFLDLGVILDDEIFAHETTDERTISQHSVEFTQNQPSPRFIKSHMPLDLLPTVVNSNCKIICVARNPKDVIVSAYNFHKNIGHLKYQGTFEQFCDDFMADNTLYGPYWEYVKESWATRDRPNTLFLFYEELKKDLPASIKKVAKFFDKTYSDEQIAKLAEHLHIDNFRKNPMVNQPGPGRLMKAEDFIRQGKVGGSATVFTPEIVKRLDKWIADNLKDTDLRFPI